MQIWPLTFTFNYNGEFVNKRKTTCRACYHDPVVYARFKTRSGPSIRMYYNGLYCADCFLRTMQAFP